VDNSGRPLFSEVEFRWIRADAEHQLRQLLAGNRRPYPLGAAMPTPDPDQALVRRCGLHGEWMWQGRCTLTGPRRPQSAPNTRTPGPEAQPGPS
jgi:hypothetical protein